MYIDCKEYCSIIRLLGRKGLYFSPDICQPSFVKIFLRLQRSTFSPQVTEIISTKTISKMTGTKWTHYIEQVSRN